MDDLVVDTQLTAVVVEDEDANAATTIVEGILDTTKEAALVEDRETLLDVTSLGHADDAAILTDVKNTVLLEDRSEHVLDDNRGSRIGDEARLLMQLLGEEVDSKVTMLTSLSRGGDTDDLARTALEDDRIANADVVAWDGNGVGRHDAGRRGTTV